MATSEEAVRRRRLVNHKVEKAAATRPATRLAASPPAAPAAPPHKQFAPRESVLTALLAASPHIRAIYNIFLAILVVLFLNTVIYDFVDSGKINVGWSTVVAGFGDPLRALRLWLFELAAALAAYPGLRLFAAGHRLVRHHTVLKRCWCAAGGVGVVLLQAALVTLPVRSLAASHLAIASAVAVTCEMFRFVMKIHAFVWSVVPRTTGEREEALPTLKQYLYFLFAPTLLYRDQYPRTAGVRWRVVAARLAEVAAVIFYNSFLWERFILPHWSHYGKSPQAEAGGVVRGVFACVLPGLLSYLCGFYCMLHAWFNACAELLTFADRLFYEEWWTTSRFSTFHRAWNRVVHAWLLEHLHAPLSAHVGRRLAAVAVFLLSALAHELILCLSFGFFYPLLTVMFLTSGILFVPLTSRLGRRYPQALNFCVWLGFFIGNGLLWSLYPMEYFARQNCPPRADDSYFVPKSWSCPVISLKPGWRFHNPLHALFV